MIEEGKANVFDKSKAQRELAHFGLARKGRIKANVFDKPKDQREFAHFGLAIKRLNYFEYI